jgi:hypothetical protein
MNRLLKLNLSYLILAILLFTIEILIALFVHDRIVRPYIGDFLVVILIYCFLKSFLQISSIKIAVAALIFAYVIEILQYFSLVNRLGLGHSKVVRVILGSSFAWLDIVAYTTGILVILLAEKLLTRTNLNVKAPN